MPEAMPARETAQRQEGTGAPSLMEPTHFDQADTERVEPGQQTLQSRAVDYLAAQHRLDWCYGRGEIKIEQGLGRKNPGDANLVPG
jgi:hypothetical protein